MKKILSLLVFALTLVLLAGCPSAPQIKKEPVFKQLPEDTIEHGASGMQFPASIGEFTRVKMLRYNDGGTDVSGGYNLYAANGRDCLVAATIYVYPAPRLRSFGSPQNVVDAARNTLFQNTYQKAKNEIIQYHPGAKVLSETPSQPPNQSAQTTGIHAQFSYMEDFAGKVCPVESHLYLYGYVNDYWLVKYRISLPEDTSNEARQKLDEFLKSIKWTITPRG